MCSGIAEDTFDISDNFANLIAEYIVQDYFAADCNSVDTAWFIKVIKSNLQSNGGDTCDYKHEVVKEANFHKGHFLEWVWLTLKASVYSELVICPIVNFEERKKDPFLYNVELTNIIYYIETIKMLHL